MVQLHLRNKVTVKYGPISHNPFLLEEKCFHLLNKVSLSSLLSIITLEWCQFLNRNIASFRSCPHSSTQYSACYKIALCFVLKSNKLWLLLLFFYSTAPYYWAYTGLVLLNLLFESPLVSMGSINNSSKRFPYLVSNIHSKAKRFPRILSFTYFTRRTAWRQSSQFNYPSGRRRSQGAELREDGIDFPCHPHLSS